MPSQTSKILFIGAGAWSTKVSRILQEQDPNIEVQIISARNFLVLSGNSSEYLAAFDEFEFIWITTNPILQNMVLKNLRIVKTKVIIEKPLALNNFELLEMKEVISISNSEIYLSQPWTHSDIWKKFLRFLTDLKSINKIEFVRGDNKMRPDFAPGVDWIPHDFYLVASLAEIYEIDDSEVHIAILNNSPERISADIKFDSRLRILIDSGIFPTRIAQASGFANQKLVLTTNFVTGEIECLEEVSAFSDVLPSDTTIMNMIRHFRSNSPNLNWDLVFKLYSSILR